MVYPYLKIFFYRLLAWIAAQIQGSIPNKFYYIGN